jgi:hypothetical protein
MERYNVNSTSGGLLCARESGLIYSRSPELACLTNAKKRCKTRPYASNPRLPLGPFVVCEPGGFLVRRTR